MIVRNNKYWIRRIKHCRGGDSSFGPVNFDWSKCKTIRIKAVAAHATLKMYKGRRISVGRIVMFSPGKY